MAEICLFPLFTYKTDDPKELIEKVEPDLKKVLPLYLMKKRWYPAKEKKIRDLSLTALSNLADAKTDRAYFMYRLDLTLDEGEKQQYFLPLTVHFGALPAGRDEAVIARGMAGDREASICDGVSWGGFAKAMIVHMGEGGKFPGQVSASVTDTGEKLFKTLHDAEEKFLSVEQSNSSAVIGKKAIIKFYRRTTPGTHPEIQVSRFLTETAKFKHTPAFLGCLQVEDGKGVPTYLAIVQEFVLNRGDSWYFTQDHLRGFIGALKKGKKNYNHAPYLEMIRLLGVRTAEMHLAFASGTDKEFAPEKTTPEDLSSWVKDVKSLAAKAKKQAKEKEEALSETERETLTELLGQWNKIDEAIEDCALSELSAWKTRFHGDYHLGQVVVTEKDFYILDFEGEPLKPLAERMNRHTPVKDVAGMVRSFDYAAWAGLFNFAKEEEQEDLATPVLAWRDLAIQAFMEGYEEKIKGCPSYPADMEDAAKLLRLFMLEKALYEFTYEVANRPSWLKIPTSGLLKLIQTKGK